MAVTIPATGSGTATPVVASDLVAGEHTQFMKLRDGTAGSTAAIPGDATNGLDVDVTRVQGTVTVAGTVGVSGAVDTELPAAAALADATANPTAPAVGSANLLFNGTTWDRARGDIANGLDVDVTRVGGTVTVAGTVAVSSVAGAVDTELPAAAALADNAANPTAPAVGAFGMVWDGATWDRAAGNSADGALVNLGTNNDVAASGVAAVDAAVAGNPIAVAGRASNAVPTAVSADGDVVIPWLHRTGAQVVTAAPHVGMLGDPFTLTSKTAQYTTAQTGIALWTPAAGKRLVITSVQIQVGGTTAGTAQLWFGAAADTTYTRGTDLAIFDGEFAPSATLKPGVVQSGLWPASAADHVLRVTTSAAITLTVTVWGYEA